MAASVVSLHSHVHSDANDSINSGRGYDISKVSIDSSNVKEEKNEKIWSEKSEKSEKNEKNIRSDRNEKSEKDKKDRSLINPGTANSNLQNSTISLSSHEFTGNSNLKSKSKSKSGEHKRKQKRKHSVSLTPSQKNLLHQNFRPDAPILFLSSLNDTFEDKCLYIPYYPEVLKLGRQINSKTQPAPTNGFFDSRVLSRQHAELWSVRSQPNRVYIRDVKSSNGTYINGHRLAPEGTESEPYQLNEKDIVELGIDIKMDDSNDNMHKKIAALVDKIVINNPSDFSNSPYSQISLQSSLNSNDSTIYSTAKSSNTNPLNVSSGDSIPSNDSSFLPSQNGNVPKKSIENQISIQFPIKSPLSFITPNTFPKNREVNGTAYAFSRSISMSSSSSSSSSSSPSSYSPTTNSSILSPSDEGLNINIQKPPSVDMIIYYLNKELHAAKLQSVEIRRATTVMEKIKSTINNNLQTDNLLPKLAPGQQVNELNKSSFSSKDDLNFENSSVDNSKNIIDENIDEKINNSESDSSKDSNQINNLESKQPKDEVSKVDLEIKSLEDIEVSENSDEKLTSDKVDNSDKNIQTSNTPVVENLKEHIVFLESQVSSYIYENDILSQKVHELEAQIIINDKKNSSFSNISSPSCEDIKNLNNLKKSNENSSKGVISENDNENGIDKYFSPGVEPTPISGAVYKTLSEELQNSLKELKEYKSKVREYEELLKNKTFINPKEQITQDCSLIKEIDQSKLRNSSSFSEKIASPLNYPSPNLNNNRLSSISLSVDATCDSHKDNKKFKQTLSHKSSNVNIMPYMGILGIGIGVVAFLSSWYNDK